MRLTRREVLQSLCIGVVGAPFLAGGMARAQAYTPFMLVLDGTDGAPARDKMRLLSEAIIRRNVPLGLALPADAGDEAFSAALALRAAYGGMFEPVVFLPGMETERVYFQMRRAGIAQARLAALATRSEDGALQHAACVTMLCRQGETEVPTLSGVRAGGFRTVLVMPKEDAPTSYSETENGIMHVAGGLRLGSLAELDERRGKITQRMASDEPAVLYVSLADITRFDDDRLAALAAALADFIAEAEDEGKIATILPSEFYLRSEAFSRDIALHLDLGSGAAPTDAETAFVKALTAAGIAFTRSGGADVTDGAGCPMLGTDPQMPDWQAVRAAAGVAFDLDKPEGEAAPVTCAVTAKEGPDAALLSSAGITVTAVLDGGEGNGGLDENGLLNVPVAFRIDGGLRIGNGRELAETLNTRLGHERDALVMVGGAALAEGGAGEVIAGVLGGLAVRKGNRVTGLGAFGAAVTGRDPIFGRLQRSQQMRFAETSAGEAVIDAAEKARLEADAELAWRYFTRLSDKWTGLAPASAEASGSSVVPYPFVTMWDIASQIFGLVAAHALGLATDDEFAEAAGKILKSLPATRIGKLRLPQANVSTRRGGAVENSYNASDTGRLLVALKLLAGRGLDKDVAAVLARWDLAATISQRRMHDIDDGRWKTYFRSNYAHYAARGFALWGMEVDTPYAPEPEDVATDRRMRILGKVADIGAVGTEPHTLEAMEFGASEAAQVISDVLFAAQVDEYRRTGRFVCVSESSIDRAPWFVYQGLEVDAEEDPWALETMVDRARYGTPEMRRALDVVNCKGAYLWNAVRPHAYSARLVEHVRERGRVPGLGFASGIYAATGRQTTNYSDVNTNGVILEAIAYTLKGRTALL
ncbi:uncharacterized protein DUF3131 [Ciceribacter lividus]|uniref:Uncharacterized protein DUF3131 n=1 Tax=Ciceribacter lividus TaxID=1197950 RepID=A0A6I7HS63_9HYPH|nr:DUF3131 domain-containing protein [Ciceribacter lividus]RCW28741.1 uncharacterized protein DUF3131 [Ciceribacter lividus]